MLADDPLCAGREQFAEPLPACYRHAFDAIDADPNHELVVACPDAAVVGSPPLGFLPGPSRGIGAALLGPARPSSAPGSAVATSCS